MASWQNGQIDCMASWQIGKLPKCQVGKMTLRQQLQLHYEPVMILWSITQGTITKGEGSVQLTS